jgi:hypothetical protein
MPALWRREIINATRMAEHLLQYPRYAASWEKGTSRINPSKQLFKQSTLQNLSLTSAEKTVLDKLAAYAVYCGARPFQLYQKLSIKKLTKKLNSIYHPPSAYLLTNRLLDNCYGETWNEFLHVLKNCEVLNVSVDESSTINRDRVINACILTEHGPFCLKYEKVNKGTSFAERQTKWLADLLDKLK